MGAWCCLLNHRGGSTDALDSFSSPQASVASTAYSAMPDRAYLVRKATAPVLERAIAPAWLKTARKPGDPSHRNTRGIALFSLAFSSMRRGFDLILHLGFASFAATWFGGIGF